MAKCDDSLFALQEALSEGAVGAPSPVGLPVELRPLPPLSFTLAPPPPAISAPHGPGVIPAQLQPEFDPGNEPQPGLEFPGYVLVEEDGVEEEEESNTAVEGHEGVGGVDGELAMDGEAHRPSHPEQEGQDQAALHVGGRLFLFEDDSL